ncbi:hypothetical protein ACHAQJ_007169 [Trichoderma viride]
MTSTLAKLSGMGLNPNEAPTEMQCEGTTPDLSPCPDYPQLRPQSLARRQQVFERVGASLVFLCLALLVLAFGLVIALKNHQDVEESTWKTLQDITVKLGTLFPIAFAAVFGQAIKRYTAWRLERGTHLAFIEQMMGSLTIGGFLSTTYTLRALNVATIILLVVWTMSPLGSQASLLMFTKQPVIVTSPSTITYLDTILGNTQFSSGDLYVVPTLNALYNACLLEPNTTRNSDSDLWGNVKIPDIRKSWLAPGDDGCTTWGTYGAVSMFGNGTQFDFPAGLLSFQSIANVTPLRLRARCPITIAYVESSIFCSGKDCTATAIRPSRQGHPDSNYTALSFAATFQEFSKNFIASVGQGLHDDTSSPTEFFLSDPSSADLAGFASANFHGLTTEQVATRLQQAINTYWYGSFSPAAMMGGMANADALNRTSTGIISVAHEKYVVQ